MTFVHVSFLVAAILPELALVMIYLMLALIVSKSLAWNGRAVMRLRLFLTFHEVLSSCNVSGTLVSLSAWLMSFLSLSKLISSSLAAPSLMTMIVLCEIDAGPIFFPLSWMVFHCSRAGGVAGGGGGGGGGFWGAFPFSFALLVGFVAFVVLEGPAGGALFAGGLLVLVEEFFLFFSVVSMPLPISQGFRLILFAKAVVLAVRVVTCLTSSCLVITSVLLMPVMVSISKSSVSVLRLVRLVRLRPLTPAVFPDLAGPALKFNVIRSRFSYTKPSGGGRRSVLSKKASVGGMILHTDFIGRGSMAS